MTYMLHVGTYLMRATRLQDALYERHEAETLHHFPVGHGGFAYSRVGGSDRHAKPVLRITGDIALYPALILREMSPDERLIRAVRGLVEELLAEL